MIGDRSLIVDLSYVIGSIADCLNGGFTPSSPLEIEIGNKTSPFEVFRVAASANPANTVFPKMLTQLDQH